MLSDYNSDDLIHANMKANVYICQIESESACIDSRKL